jgi:3-phosphoshikimate 1-carboxyvinyltransferase
MTSGRVDPLPIEPMVGPLGEHTVVVPGSKSITNRALVCAALADDQYEPDWGESTLTGVLRSDDTEAMVGCLQALGIEVVPDWEAETILVQGCGGRIPAHVATLDCRLSGTTSRFMLPLAALGHGRYVIDGAEPLRRRPMGPSLQALRGQQVGVEELGAPGHLPVAVHGPMAGWGVLDVPGDASSQFLSGLLMAGATCGDLIVRIAPGTTLVSRPYVEMTIAVMNAFGQDEGPGQDGWAFDSHPYRGRDFAVEPDASAASYFFAAAALLGGSVTVHGLGSSSLQGDIAFVDVLARMGADVDQTDTSTTVTGTGVLRGGVFDFTHISDTAQTLAAIAPFADSPVSVTGIGFIRGKETDRIKAVVTELQRADIQAKEKADGFVVHPGTPHPAVIETYDDHRMAMAFALLGLKVSGIQIADPGCVAKTFPGYWDVLDGLRAT